MAPPDSSYVPKPRAVKHLLKNELPPNTGEKKRNTAIHGSDVVLTNITDSSFEDQVRCQVKKKIHVLIKIFVLSVFF